MTLLKSSDYNSREINVALLSLEADIKNKIAGFDTSVIDKQLAEINSRIDKINAGGNNTSAEINDIRYEIEDINSKLNGNSAKIKDIEQKLTDIFSAENKVTDFNTTTDSGIYYWVTDAANKPDANYGVLLINKYDSGSTNIWINQIAYGTNNKIYFRQNINSGNWTEWKAVAFDGEITANKVVNALTVNGETYDGSEAVDAGVQKIENGGTGVTTQADINKAFISNLGAGNDNITDGTEFVSSYASDKGFTDPSGLNKPYKRQFIKVWNYINNKISSVLGLTSEKVSSYDSHLTNKDNPHSVTKSQVGLDAVVNTGDSATPVSGGTTKFTTGGAYTELNKKVDKVDGKGLSSNDFTDTYKGKLDNIDTTVTADSSNLVTSGAVSTAISTEVTNRNTAITNAINNLDVSSVGGDGKYISAISETDGKISATSTTMDTAPTTNSVKAVTSGGIKTAISTAETNAKNLANATGTLAVAHGGTGVTTQADINKAFIGNLNVGNDNVTDGTEFVSSWASDNGFAESSALNKPYKRQFIKVWNYIKGKISSVLGLTATNYGGKAATAGTADKTVNDITIEIPFVTESGQYVIPFGNIPEPTSTEINSPYNWDITGFFSIIRPAGHNGAHLYFEAGHGYSHDWTTYAYLDKLEFRNVVTSIKAFQYNGKWWLGLCLVTPNQGYTSKMTITYSRGLPATPTCILYYSKSNGIANEEIYNSIQDIPSSWWKPRTIYNPTTFTQNITAPVIQATTNFIGNLTGTASTADKATNDGNGNNIVNTYALKSNLQYTKSININKFDGSSNTWYYLIAKTPSPDSAGNIESLFINGSDFMNRMFEGSIRTRGGNHVYNYGKNNLPIELYEQTDGTIYVYWLVSDAYNKVALNITATMSVTTYGGNLSAVTPTGSKMTLTEYDYKSYGTFPISRGGTGATTAKDAFMNLANGLSEDNGPLDTEYVIYKNTGGTHWGLYTLSTFWNYIKNKISSVLGLTKDNYGGKAAKSSFLDEYPGAGGTRLTSLNIVPKDSSEYGGMRKDVLTDSVTDGSHPGINGHLLTMFWDNTGRYDSQFFISNNTPLTLKARFKANTADYGAWTDIITSNNIGSQTVANATNARTAADAGYLCKLYQLAWATQTYNVILLGKIPDPASTEAPATPSLSWDIDVDFYFVRTQGHKAAWCNVKAGYGYSNAWRKYGFIETFGVDSSSNYAKPFSLITLKYNNEYYIGVRHTVDIDGKYSARVKYVNTNGNSNPSTVDNTSLVNMLKVIPYQKTSDGTILNSEIKSSIADFPNTYAPTVERNGYLLLKSGYVRIGTGSVAGSKLTIQGRTVNSNSYTDTNPKLEFKNSDESQNISLTYTDFDAVQAPASLTLNGNQGNEYFIAPNIKATTKFIGNLTGNVTGSATSAGKLTTARKTYVTLGTASTTETRDWSGDTTIPVDGVLQVEHGGTGCNTAEAAANSLISNLPASDNVPVDTDYFISQHVNGGPFVPAYQRRPISKLWEYIKDKILQEGEDFGYNHIVHDDASLLEWANCTDGSMKKVLVKSGTYNMTKGVDFSKAGTGYVFAENGAVINSKVPIAFTAPSGKTAVHNLKVVCGPSSDNTCAFSANDVLNLILYDCEASYATNTVTVNRNLFSKCTCYNCHYNFTYSSSNSSMSTKVFYQCYCYNCICKQTIAANSSSAVSFADSSYFYKECVCVSCDADLTTLRNIKAATPSFSCYYNCWDRCVGCLSKINVGSSALTVYSTLYGFMRCQHMSSCKEVHTVGYSNIKGVVQCIYVSSTSAVSGESNTNVGNSCDI